MLRTVITICTMLLISLILLTSLCHASPETSSPLTLNPQAGAKRLRENKHWPYITFDKETREQLLQANAGEKQIPAGRSTVSRNTLLAESQRTWSYIIHLLETTQNEPGITTALIDELYQVVTGNDLPADHNIVIRFLFPMQNFDVINDYQALYTWLSTLPGAEYTGNIYAYYDRNKNFGFPVNGKQINTRIRVAKNTVDGLFTKDIITTLKDLQRRSGAPWNLHFLKNIYITEQVASLLDTIHADRYQEATWDYPKTTWNYMDIPQFLLQPVDNSNNWNMPSTTHYFTLGNHEQFSFTLLRPVTLFPGRNTSYVRSEVWKKFNQRVKNVTSKEEYIECVADLSWDMYHLQLFPDANKRMAHFLSAYLLLAYNLSPPVIDHFKLFSVKKGWREHVRQNRGIKKSKERWAKDVRDVYLHLKKSAPHEHEEL